MEQCLRITTRLSDDVKCFRIHRAEHRCVALALAVPSGELAPKDSLCSHVEVRSIRLRESNADSESRNNCKAFDTRRERARDNNRHPEGNGCWYKRRLKSRVEVDSGRNWSALRQKNQSTPDGCFCSVSLL